MSATWPAVLAFCECGELTSASNGWFELSGACDQDGWVNAFAGNDGEVAVAAVRGAANGLDMAPARLWLSRGGAVEMLVAPRTNRQDEVVALIRPLGEVAGDQFHQDLAEAMPDGIAIVQWARDGKWRVSYANGRFCELMSMGRQQVLGAECADILRRDAEAVIAALDEAARTGSSTQMDRSRTRGGQERLIRSTFTPGQERVTGRKQITIVIRDATNTTAGERRAADQRRQESLDIMAGGLAHELNNSLLAIMGNIELAVEEFGDPSGILEDARESGVRASHLGKMLLDYTGHGHNVLLPIDVNEVVLARLTTIASVASVSIEVVTQLREGLPLVAADGGQLGHCLMSVVENSCEAMANEGGRLQVTTYEREIGSEMSESMRVAEGNYVALAVSDTGPGIPPEQAERVFEPFYTTRFLGRGLGLPSVRGIMRAHDGAVLLETAVGVGTTVTLLLPVDEAAN